MSKKKGKLNDISEVSSDGTSMKSIQRKYNLCYSWFCLLMLVCCFISCAWSKQILGSMYGFGIAGKGENPFYKIDKDLKGLTASTYGTI